RPVVADFRLYDVADLTHLETQYFPSCRGIHCIHAIAHEIDQNLLNLDRVQRNGRDITRNVEFQMDTASGRLVRQKLAGLSNDIPHQSDRSRRCRLTEQGPDAAHDISCSISVTNDALCGGLCAIDVRRFGRQPTMAGMRICDNRCKRLVYFMRYRGRELGKPGRLASTPESFLG